MTRVLEVGDYVRGKRILSLRYSRSRGWRATDETGSHHYQRGPDAQPDGLHTKTPTGVTLSVWPPPEGQQRKRMPRVSKGKAAKNEAYQGVRAFVADRADGLCEAQTSGVCTVVGVHAHHIVLRSRGGNDDGSNLLFVCEACHSHLHSHPEWAERHGLIQRPSLGQSARHALHLLRSEFLTGSPAYAAEHNLEGEVL